ncbi:MAG: Mg chelatase, subunit ChlI, magnesium chelatase family protein [Parcubacteria group bacterium GW2011_GWC1_45_9]|nr:MAG: Mg chelatase-related protein [Parcubacteria group bacterium GW2011_GWA1_Parcubacteria_45_10]KKT88715.1 MAG: Mg chelatase-related protein [Parcubacteria group bacterium GW2011_GWB1_45_10]KKU17461.1 MAG: Mg chelatase, subunit ChlI, magnesium chelatase family protein [Parcubacteria group bacterium GW2011_GWC1_45_9]
MPTKIFSAATIGVDAVPIEVEVDFSSGLHSFQIVGLADKAIEESKERISLALKNSGVKPPMSFHKKLIVNLAPADIKKEGSGYDLAIAVGFMVSSEQLVNFKPQKTIFVGELSLDGRLRKTPGILPIVELAAKNNFDAVFIPKENAKEASLFADKINIFCFDTLKELILHLEKVATQPPLERAFENIESNDFDFEIDQISGLNQAKRALAIAAAGGHNLMFKGPPGTGKTLLARALPQLLPELSLSEAVEITKIYSVANLLNNQNPLISRRPFRNPHHTASVVSIVGGGQNPKPGEISLAHRGVLFLDEIAEFNRQVLESLRQPLEEREITVSRARGSLRFPANLILVAAMNPCPCGWFGDPRHECSCSMSLIQKYQRKISGPLLDRIDLILEVPRINFNELKAGADKKLGLSLKNKVKAARERQNQRFINEKFSLNSEIKPKQVQSFCALDSETETLLEKAEKQFVLSPRLLHRIIKVSRTIADLEESENIRLEHLAEALQYRE